MLTWEARDIHVTELGIHHLASQQKSETQLQAVTTALSL